MLSISRAVLSRAVTTVRLKEVMSQLGCLVCDQQYVDTSKPNVCDCYETKSDGTEVQFPGVWRDRVSANTRLASTPEGRSLTSL